MATFHIQKYHLDIVPNFDGNSATLLIFLESSDFLIKNFGDRFNENNPQNEFLLRAIIGKLTGRALDVVGRRGSINWPDIKTLLLQSFSDQRDENCLVYDLMHIKQERNENPVTFGTRCQGLLGLLLNKIDLTESDVNVRAIRKSMYERNTLYAFLLGLHDSLPIRLRNPENLEQAIGFVIQEQNFAYAKNSMIKAYTPFEQYYNKYWQSQRLFGSPIFYGNSSPNFEAEELF